MKYLITGATGHLGGAVLDSLLQKISANNISTLSRKQEMVAEMQNKGMNAFLGSYDDIASLEKAMYNIDMVLLISSTDEGNRIKQHENVVNTAKKMGVKCIAYTSRSLENKSTLENHLMLEHFKTEEYIINSSLKYIIFRNALYMDVLPLFVGKQVFDKGIFQPAGNGKVAFALRKEMGEAIANVLSEENCNNSIYHFTGTEAYSFNDVGDTLTELSGKDVKYTPLNIPDFKDKMKDTGLPEQMVQKIINFNTDIKNGQESYVSNDLENKLGRKPATLQEGLKLLFKL